MLPLEKYEGKDIVLWGERPLVEAGDIQGAAVDCSSMYLRISHRHCILLLFTHKLKVLLHPGTIPC